MEMPRKWSFSFFFLNFNLNLNFLFLWATITSEQYLRHFLAQTEIRIKNFYVEIAQVRSAIFFFRPTAELINRRLVKQCVMKMNLPISGQPERRVAIGRDNRIGATERHQPKLPCESFAVSCRGCRNLARH